MCVSSPQDKLAKLHGLVDMMSTQWAVGNLHTLESLVGHLVHASKVCPLNNLFAVLLAMKPRQYRRFNLAARADLAWWQALLASWSGTSILQFLILRHADLHLFPNASGSWGCGTWFGSQWFQVPWPSHSVLSTPALRELYAIGIACAGWDQDWSDRLVLCHSDNAAAVTYVNRLHARGTLACHMLRWLAFF